MKLNYKTRMKIRLTHYLLAFVLFNTFIISLTSKAQNFSKPSSLALSTQSAQCQHTPTSFKCVKYLKNYDGDTLTVNIPGVHPLFGDHVSVRVKSIDTPEIKGKLPCEKEKARIAQKLIENLLKNARTIELANVERDKYFRVLADVIVDQKNLSEVLIKNQLAYKYEGGTKEKTNWCLRKPASP